MMIILSPAKTMDCQSVCNTMYNTEPLFAAQAQLLIRELQEHSTDDIAGLMKVNQNLALLNYERYQLWNTGTLPEIQACCAYKGEVYNGLKATEMNESTLLYMQNHLRILSGLYGILKPLDMVKPYRLEMGITLKSGSLYAFWGNKIRDSLQQELRKSKMPLINLASLEYFKSVKPKDHNFPIITPEFKEYKNGKHVVVTVYAKKARGLMTRFIMENRIENPDDLKAFDYDGYYYNPHVSTPEFPVFTR
jgi:uncharacterized protein